MRIFKRIGDIFRANVNHKLDQWEDPEKMIKQMVREMEDAVNQATSALATAIAQEKKLERDYKQHQNASQNWEQKAMQALNAGNEDLARKALSKKASAEDQSRQYQQMYESSVLETQKLKEQVDVLKQKLTEARMRETSLIARSKALDAKKEIAKKVGNIDTGSSFAKFDQLEEKIMKKEAEAEAFAHLASDNDESTEPTDDFKQLENKSRVDDDLARLRAKLNKDE